MQEFPIRESLSGAAAGRLYISPEGRISVAVRMPAGGGRKHRLELSLPQARALHEALGGVLGDADAALGPLSPRERR